MRGQRARARRRATRPRYSRIAAAVSAVTITLVSLLGATGVLPTSSGAEPAFAAAARPTGPASPVLPQPTRSAPPAVVQTDPAPPMLLRQTDRVATPTPTPTPMPMPTPVTDAALPEQSGEGRRIVFDMSEQRVWLVATANEVQRTYLVSGSLTDNLGTGTYEVYSKSVDAVGVDDSGTMKYMVRFASGENAAIGFHDIPVRGGRLLQTRAELGTPQSHGCIRQWRPDAKALWDFAPVGTKVVVVA
ncbi:MAG: L,D-transpeptidase [Nocardioidaceae bacterium]